MTTPKNGDKIRLKNEELKQIIRPDFYLWKLSNLNVVVKLLFLFNFKKLVNSNFFGGKDGRKICQHFFSKEDHR